MLRAAASGTKTVTLQESLQLTGRGLGETNGVDERFASWEPCDFLVEGMARVRVTERAMPFWATLKEMEVGWLRAALSGYIRQGKGTRGESNSFLTPIAKKISSLVNLFV